MSPDYFGDGEFEFIKDETDRKLYKNMHNAISKTELWNWMRGYTPPEYNGFMFAKTPELIKIERSMAEEKIYECHSSSSYSCMMRDMEFIAKNGYATFKQDLLNYYKKYN